jgi:hypothetical protein
LRKSGYTLAAVKLSRHRKSPIIWKTEDEKVLQSNRLYSVPSGTSTSMVIDRIVLAPRW